MERRTFLATAVSAGTLGLSGCIAGGRVVHDVQKSIMVEPHRGWVYEITDVDGDGSVSFTVRSDRRFDVYYFTNEANYERYEAFVGGNEPAKMPSGHDDLSKGAVHNEERDVFEVEAPRDGGRMGISVDSTHYFVVDHSNYGMGVPVEKHDDPLRAFVDLEAYNKTFPI